MNDYIVEVTVKRKQTWRLKTRKMLMVLLGVAFMVLEAFVPFAAVCGVAVFTGAYVLFKRWNLEFEYALAGMSLDITKIMSKETRKEVQSLNLMELSCIVEGFEKNIGGIKFDKICDYSSLEEKAAVDALVYESGICRTAYLIDADNEIGKKVKLLFPGKIVRGDRCESKS
ncbi:hypothetical protein [Anaerobium acetethylicum]|uniref:Uncharacterized protein n=1 Tax=Anaerobium acetethylicum TaxID=1619234 RepID=A0A1D3TTH2_9FIRM|nr:hypothetical protein [Anaerobium acetethylicum]SCP97243.1 hypothetical protein SAMN05421730_100959 [Anaerobium acetethylicum]